MIQQTATKQDVQAFSDACIRLRATWDHFKTLFEHGGRREALLKTIAPMVFGDIRRMMLEHLVLQICVVTDPPQTLGRKNLTVKWLLEHCDFNEEPAKLEMLKGLSKSIHEFREIILPARNRYISHLDVETIRLGDTLGAAEDSKWQQFWIDLEEFLEIVYGHYISPNMRLSRIAQRSLKTSQFHVADAAALLGDNPIAALYVATVLAAANGKSLTSGFVTEARLKD
jgi:HEPN superfamily AbiU2-like protein